MTLQGVLGTIFNNMGECMGSSAKKHPGMTGRIAFILAGVILILFPAVHVHADEVDDILALKSKNRDKIKRFSAEYTVETKGPKQTKPSVMKYRIKVERMDVKEAKGSPIPFRSLIEVTAPYAMNLKVEGDRVWMQKHEKWEEQTLPPQVSEQFSSMSERFLVTDPSQQRKYYDIKVVQHNNSIFGPKTRTISLTPKGKTFLFSRMEEDVDEAGISLASRVFDNSGKKTVSTKVMKHHMIYGFPVADEIQTTSQTPAGETVITIYCRGVEVE